jgi:DNA-binding LacI/PurR family transcriptional regulator
VRKALLSLRRDGLIRTAGRRQFGVPTGSVRPKAGASAVVGLLLPEPIERARPFTTLWIGELSTLLAQSGSRLEVIAGQKYYGTRSGKSLENLVSSQRRNCWVLARSNRPLQQWFHDRGLPAVIAGTAHPDIAIPSVDTDHIALGRHAAAQLLRQGHRKVGMFLETFQHAGDIETEQGFRQALTSAGASEPTISRVERNPEAVIRELKRLLALRVRPTGFLLVNSFAYLTVQTYFASLGHRIPQDFSLLSQDEGPFLSHVYPSPARYVTNPQEIRDRIESRRQGCPEQRSLRSHQGAHHSRFPAGRLDRRGGLISHGLFLRPSRAHCSPPANARQSPG